MRIRVSIVIRNYNYDRFVGNAVDSALAQIYPETDVIVVDDGSTDQSRDILRSYGTRIRLVLQPNGGEGAAINSGFAKATGEWVIFLDSDDVLTPNCASRLVDAARSPDITRIHWWMHLMNDAGRLTGHVQPTGPVPRLGFEESMARYGFMISFSQSSNAYRRDILARILPLDAGAWPRGPDIYLNAASAAAGQTAFVDAPLGARRVHGENLSLQNSLVVSVNHHALRIYPCLETELKTFMGPQRAARFQMTYPFGYWRNRLASLRLDPTRHPYPEDRRDALVRRMLVCATGGVPTMPAHRALKMLGTVVLGYMPRPVLQKVYPLLVKIARYLPLYWFGSRTAFRRTATLGVRAGMLWREAFQVPAPASGRPDIPAGTVTPHNSSTVGAMSRTLPPSVRPGE